MTSQTSSYRQIVKATSIFGGVQVINIIIAIVRSKFIAVLLGPIGIGISGMLTATTGIINGLTNFGLGTSAVREISTAYETGNSTRLSIAATVLQKWVWVTGTLGLLVMLIFSPLLSYLSFGNWNYTIPYMVLSITLLVNQLNSGQLVIIQGSRKLSFLAKANLWGSIIGLFTTIPLYYVWGIKGIVPAMIISSAIGLIISYYFRKKINIEKIEVSKVRVFAEGRSMLKMGFIISISGFLTLGFSYLVRLFINYKGGIEDVGFYTAGFAIINTYVDVIFTAMGTDYYPRLTAVSNDLLETNKTINQQAEIGILILGPIIIAFILFINWIVSFFYTKEFKVIDEMLIWAAYGMLFKAVSWSIGFILLAKGSSQLFFWNELIANIYTIALNIICYCFFGLTGLGISFLISFLIHLIQMYIVGNLYFKFKFSPELIRLAIIQFALTTTCIILFKKTHGLQYVFLGGGTLLCSSLFSLFEMNKRIGLKQLFSKIYKR